MHLARWLFVFPIAVVAACAMPDDPPELATTEQATMWEGEIKTLVLLAEFEQNVPAATAVTWASEQMKALDTYIRANSYERAWIEPTIVGPYLLSPHDCHSNGWDGFNDAKILREAALLADPIVDFSQIDLVIVLSKDTQLCPPGNSGTAPGAPVPLSVPTTEPITGGWVRMTLAPSAPPFSPYQTYAHELGHVMNGVHIEARRCFNADGSPATLVHSAAQGTCAIEYDHHIASEPLNGRYSHFSAANKQLFGWLTPNEVVSSRNGQYTLTPLTSAGGLKLLEIPLLDSTHVSYTLEYRQPVGYDANPYPGSPTLSGVFLHAKYRTSATSWILEAVDVPPFETGPIELTPLPLASLLPGGGYIPSYIDTAQGIAIFVYSTSPTGAVVAVTPAKNWARSSNGGVISASSTYNAPIYARGYANDGVRVGHSWGGWWNAATAANVPGGCYSSPPWIYVRFNTLKTIYEVDLFGLQDNYGAEWAPYLGMIANNYGPRHFHVQYLSVLGTWDDVPGGYITWNNQVWNKLTFAPVSTTYVRVKFECMQDSWARMIEMEAYGW